MPRQPLLKENPLWYQFMLFAVLVLISFLITILLGALLPSSDWAARTILGSVGCFLLPALVFGALVYVDPIRETGFRMASSPWYYCIAALIVVIAMPIVQYLAAWNAGLHLPQVLHKLDEGIRNAEKVQDEAIKRTLKMPSPSYFVGTLITMALAPAICEEAFFRGVLQKLLIKAAGWGWLGILLGAIFFSAMHFQFLGFFPRVLLGIVLGCLYFYSGSLWPSILGHFIYNGTQVVYFYLQQHQDLAHPNAFYSDDVSMPLSLSLLSALLVFLCLFWMNRIKPSTWP